MKNRGQRSEVRSQKSEVRGQRSEMRKTVIKRLRLSLRGTAVAISTIHYSLFTICYLLFAICSAFASTLSTNFAEVFVDNLKIGGSYNLTEVANFPMWVGYRGDVPTDLKIEIVTPSSTDLKSGYEPIPDVSWITVSRNIVSLLPDESANLDVTINIPNDERHLGKKYQAYVHVVTLPPKDARAGIAVSLALKGRILFGVAQKPPTEEELRELRKRRIRASQGVIITPEKFKIETSGERREARGQRIEVTEYEPLKIINPSRERVEIFLEAVEPGVSGISLPRNYQKGDLKDLVLSKRRFTLRPDDIRNVRIWVDGRRKTGDEKKFYVIRVNIKSPTIEVAKFVRIYIGSEK